MKAARFERPGIIDCIEVPDLQPRPGKVLVRMLQASLCGSDLHAVYMPLGPMDGPARPGAPGHEGVGEVVDSDDPRFPAGTVVLTAPNVEEAACFADYQLIDPAYLVALPQGARPDHLVVAQPFGTAIFGLKQALGDSGTPDCAVVSGQGAIGLFFTWLLKRRGVRTVIAIEPDAGRRALSASYGADLALDPAGDPVADAVRDVAGSGGAPFVVEAAGRDASRASAIRLAADEARVLLFGMPESMTMDGFPFGDVFLRRLTLISTHSSQEEADLASFRQAVDHVARGDLPVEPLTRSAYRLDDIREAFEAAHHCADGVVKARIDFT
ncbi:zinc-binding dehydrogenase [Kaustia mangrovi]|uniref:Zinc-binding dehydrogenase n=1 Tax=Kaustia mangrovi TaxID=2593653 RepID=A0A7S8HCP1_9HYPH|nr:zinc-binding dehydrogenase [Kaustia mangrovi]QPC43831.1 zinc-binding dehydrogenase [Kaustia mangrovi]